MKKRTIWKMFALTILTLGIYRLYWFIKTRQEMMTVNPNVKIISPLFLLIPFMLIILGIGGFIYTTSQTSRVYDIASECQSPLVNINNTQGIQNDSDLLEQNNCQVPQSSAPLWGIIALYTSFLLFYPLLAIWLWGYSKGVDAITGGNTSFAIALIVLLLVPDGFDILIIQDSFNKVADGTPAPPTTSSAPTPVAA